MIHFKNISGDISGVITAAVVALPLALAFGVQSGMGAIAGLYGAIALGLIAALLGGTKTQISGPTGPMAVVAAAVIASEVAYYGSVDAAFPTIIATFVLAGVFQLLLGVSGIGHYIRYMPYPVISGFMTGIGLIIILLQLFPFFGLESPTKVMDVITSIDTIIPNMNMQAMLLASATIAIIYLMPLVTKKLPSTLVALISLSVLSTLMHLDVPIIGDIPKGLPEVHVDTLFRFDWKHPMVLIIPAITLAALGSIDSLLTSVVADNMTKSKHDSNKELIGQGIGNMLAGIVGGLPGAGATMRTVVNINAGGRERLSGVVHAVVLLVVLLGAGNYAALIPLPVLAGVLVTVGIGIIDYKGLKHMLHVPRSDMVVMLIVLVLTVTVDLLQAVAVGVVLASILFMKQMGDTLESKTYTSLIDDNKPVMFEDEKSLQQDHTNTIYVQHFDGPIFFGFTAYFSKVMSQMPDVKIVILRMDNVPYIDQSGIYALEDAMFEFNKKGVVVLISGMQKQPLSMLSKIKFIPELIPYERIFKDYETLKNFIYVEKN
ncbi:MAG TPA: SulP family inorganic anion transporter [Helicobacteraceae bacterium]|nr:SulP family inorganic anion transporter [Helicobacteraceae bacterium]